MGAANQHFCVARWSHGAETQFQWPCLGSKFYCSCTCYGEHLFSCPSHTYTFSCVLLSYKTSVKHVVFLIREPKGRLSKANAPSTLKQIDTAVIPSPMELMRPSLRSRSPGHLLLNIKVRVRWGPSKHPRWNSNQREFTCFFHIFTQSKRVDVGTILVSCCVWWIKHWLLHAWFSVTV